MNTQIRTTERQLRERRSWILAGLISLALLSCLAFPLAFITGCDDDDYRKAVRAAAGIATSLAETQAVNERLYAAALIDREEAIAIARMVKEATLANDHFVASLRRYDRLNKNSRADLVRLVADVARSVRQLNEQGVLRIKNADARLRFRAAVDGAVTALDILAAVIGAHEAPRATPTNNLLQTRSLREGVATPTGHARRSGTVQLRAADTSAIRRWAKTEDETGAIAGGMPRHDDARPRRLPVAAGEFLRGAA